MKVFISHTKKDNNIVHRILKILDDNGIQNWVDLKQIDMGSSINQTINRAIASSNHFLLIWSKSAAESKFVEREYNAVTTPDYDDKLKKIIVKLDATPLPPLLSDQKYYDIDDESLEEVIENLAYEIKESQTVDTKHEKFDRYLNENFGDVIVASYKYTTSHALKQIDPYIYKEDMISWMDNPNEEITDE